MSIITHSVTVFGQFEELNLQSGLITIENESFKVMHVEEWHGEEISILLDVTAAVATEGAEAVLERLNAIELQSINLYDSEQQKAITIAIDEAEWGEELYQH